MIRVFLEDHGQDFLTWDIKDGVVVETHPLQGWLWNGTKIITKEFGPGAYLHIQLRFSPEEVVLNYPVEKILFIPDDEAGLIRRVR